MCLCDQGRACDTAESDSDRHFSATRSSLRLGVCLPRCFHWSHIESCKFLWDQKFWRQRSQEDNLSYYVWKPVFTQRSALNIFISGRHSQDHTCVYVRLCACDALGYRTHLKSVRTVIMVTLLFQKLMIRRSFCVDMHMASEFRFKFQPWLQGFERYQMQS